MHFETNRDIEKQIFLKHQFKLILINQIIIVFYQWKTKLKKQMQLIYKEHADERKEKKQANKLKRDECTNRQMAGKKYSGKTEKRSTDNTE